MSATNPHKYTGNKEKQSLKPSRSTAEEPGAVLSHVEPYMAQPFPVPLPASLPSPIVV